MLGLVVSLAGARPGFYKPFPTFPPPEVDADSSHNWDALHYELQLQVTPVSVPNNLTVDGLMDVLFTPEVNDLDTVDLHLHGLTVDNVRLDGVDCDWTREGDMLYVALPEPHNPGEELQLRISYHGTPVITNLITPTGIFYASTNMIYTMNDPFGARNWIPCWDEPWDKATVRLQLTLPDNFTVVSNGNFEGTTPVPPNTMWTYHMNHPITTYLISFCASDYATFEQAHSTVDIKHYVYPSHLTAAQTDFQRVPEMIDLYSDRYGAYPYDTYGYAEAPIFGGSGAMEHQTMVTYGNLLITGNQFYEDIVAHELAHMWFGDAVSYIDWPEMWLSEGFAEYSEAIWFEHLNGMTGYHQNMVQKQQTYYGWEDPNNPIPIYDPPWNEIWSALTYQKAACVLSMLRYQLGDVDFFDFMQTYASTYLHGNASTPDVMATVQQVTGEDYDWFFDQWIYQGGYPIFEYFGVWEEQTDDYLIRLSVAQIQNQTMPRFQTDADLHIFSAGNEIIERITIEALETQEIQLVVTSEPDSMQLDPNSWILGPKYRRDDLVEPVLAVENPVIDDQGGNGFLEPGEQGDLSFVLTNAGLPTPELTVELDTDDPFLTVIDGLSSTPGITFNGGYDLSEDPFVVENADPSGPRWVDFSVYVSETGSGMPVTTLEFSLPVGVPEILLVDDDGGGDAEVNHQTALNQIRRVYHIVEYTTAGELPPLTDYLGVIWVCGQETSNTLAAEDQTLLETYLVNDYGALMLSGRGVVPDLAGTDFLESVLHALSTGTTAVVVVNGIDPIVQDLSFFITGDGANQDVLDTDGTTGTGVLLEYANVSTAAAIKYDGDYRSCIVGFGFEDLQSGNPVFAEPWELMAPLVEWLTGTTGVENEPAASIPTTFEVSGCFPNPFNASTAISIQLSAVSQIDVTVYDIAGRQVATLMDGWRNPGQHRATFDGKDLASGVYLYSVEAVTQTGKRYADIGKMVLLK
jgi:hypothetical protein